MKDVAITTYTSLQGLLVLVTLLTLSLIRKRVHGFRGSTHFSSGTRLTRISRIGS